MSERPLVFACGAERLIGVAHLPDCPARIGVVVVVGGPQYRVGSHRQFVSLGRALEEGGFACLRFDYRGMGDSAAPMRNFEAVGDDLCAAIDALIEAAPAVERVVLWGLCDGASAALMYASQDARVEGVIAINPWVRSEASLAAAQLSHYYKGRLLSVHFWRRLLGGEIQFGRSIAGLATVVRKRLRGRRVARHTSRQPALSFIERMGEGWRRMRGRVLVILSGNDLTAREFADFCRTQSGWREAVMPGPNFAELRDADHTFSRSEWKRSVEHLTLEWLRSRLVLALSDSPRETQMEAPKLKLEGSA